MFDAYLDIETTGLSPLYHSITVVGLYLCDNSHQKLVQLVDEEITSSKLFEVMQDVEVIYTYNGSRFDLPFIKTSLGVDLTRYFKHHDLMLDCWKNNLYGGLKVLEVRLGIGRQLKNVNGLEAVRLWWEYKDNRNRGALATLLKYNGEDTSNLKQLREKLSCFIPEEHE